MVDDIPLLHLTQNQASLLEAQLLVYLQYLRLRVAPSVKRSQQTRMLYALTQRLFAVLDQRKPIIVLSVTREEQSLVQEGLSLLVRTLQEKPPSPERDQEITKLIDTQALLAHAWRRTND